MSAGAIISTILKHDNKVTSYKIALLRAINDVVLSFPDIRKTDVAVPLRVLAQYWIAYYWAFVDEKAPIQQGQRAILNDRLRQDMSFRKQLTELRCQWELIIGATSRASDGFLLINELRVQRKRQNYPASLHQAFTKTCTAIATAIEMPVKHAGPGNWTVFSKPVKYDDIGAQVLAIPGTQLKDKCLIIKAELWQTFLDMSLWIEALCIHEWCLFTERVQQDKNRGAIYQLLTTRPDNRRPLTWERNQVDVLLMEDVEFICPWTRKKINKGTSYDLDHILPVSVYPINELWNLVPADPDFNSNTKRDYLPTYERLIGAQPYFEMAYKHYGLSKSLSRALQEDALIRFVHMTLDTSTFTANLSASVVNLVNIFAESRNLTRF